MSRVTSKLQVTVPKAVADQVGIQPGDELDWIVSGSAIRVVSVKGRAPTDAESRLRWFDAATKRQRERQAGGAPTANKSRGWTRDELYDRDRSR